MKDAPFNISLVLVASIFVMTIAGGVFAVLLKAVGFEGFWGIFLAAFLTVPLGSVVRQAVAGAAASHEGVRGESPFAFALPIRLAIGAVATAGIAYVFSLSDFYSFGILMGATAALLTSIILIVVFFLKVALSR